MAVTTPAPQAFVVRIVSIDYYLARPAPKVDLSYAPLEGTAIDQVPVVRIFGSTPSGQKACIHLHKAFPYFYVPYDDSFPDEPAEAQGFLRQFAQSIDSAMQQHQEAGSARKQVIHAVQLVRAMPFYGYHKEERIFMKVVLYNPGQVTRIATLLQSGAIMNRAFQPHESHIPFLLQFKIDFNLYGMGQLRLGNALFRHPLPEGPHLRQGWAESPNLYLSEGQAAAGGVSSPTSMTAGSQGNRVWTTRNVPSQWLWSNVPAGARLPERQSKCELEVDACVEDILNRQQLMRMALPEAGPEVRMVESLQSMWDEEKQRIGCSPPPPPPEPLRTPTPLCLHVEAGRAQFQAIVDEHKQEEVEEEGKVQEAVPVPQAIPLTPLTAAANSLPHTASSQDVPPTPAPIATPSIAAASNTHTPDAATSAAGVAAAPAAATATPAVAATPAATPAPASLLKYTQPANLLTSSPLAATPASRQQGGAESPAHAAGVALQARPQAAGMHAPSQATQNTEEADREIKELLNWMREDGASSDEEADMLMALAQQAGPTPTSQTTRSSQKEVLQRLRERRQSRLHTSQHEIAGIMECSEQQAENLSDSGVEDGEPAAEEPRAGPQLPDQAGPSDPKLPDVEDMGDLAQELAEADSEAARDPEQRRQSTGVFAAEPDQAKWTQLLAYIDSHQLPAHEHPSSPPQQNQLPPPELAQHEALEVLAAAVNIRPTDHAAHLQSMFSSDFQYDSPDVPEDPTPQASAQDHQLHLNEPRQDYVTGNEVTRAATDAAAQEQPLHGHVPDDSDGGAVIPQVDGADDSDPSESPARGVPPSPLTSPITQDHSANHLTQNHMPISANLLTEAGKPTQLPHQSAAEDLLAPVAAAEQSQGSPQQQQQQPQQPLERHLRRNTRPRRSRQVVQHAVRLAAAARNAIDLDTAPDSPHLRAPAYDSEPQMPVWRQLQDALPARRFSSEPQLLLDQQSQRDARVLHLPAQTMRAQMLAEAPQSWSGAVEVSHAMHASQDRQLHSSQQAGMQQSLPGPRRPSSQLVSDSRATSDALWQGGQLGGPFPTQQGPVLLSQVVSDSRASSDRRWMLPAGHGTQTHGLLPSQPHASNLHTSPLDHGPSEANAVHELAWEQESGQNQADAVSPMSAPSFQEDVEVVISDSQPSPPDFPTARHTHHPPEQSQHTQQAQQAQQHSEQQQQVDGTQQPSSNEIGNAAPLDSRAKKSLNDFSFLHQEPLLQQSTSGHQQAALDNQAANVRHRSHQHFGRLVHILTPHLPSDAVAVAASNAAASDATASNTDTSNAAASNAAASNAAAAENVPVAAAGGMAAAAAAARVEARSQARRDDQTHAQAQPLQLPTFSIRLKPADANPSDEALTPVMMPPANARIQPQHAATPSHSVIKDTPQSIASGQTPLSSVKDTPWPQATTASYLPQSAPSNHGVTPYQQGSGSTAAAAASITASAVVPALDAQAGSGHAGRASQLPLASPELTLRLSLSSSSGKNPVVSEFEGTPHHRSLPGQTPTQLGRFISNPVLDSEHAQPAVSKLQPVPHHSASVGTQETPLEAYQRVASQQQPTAAADDIATGAQDPAGAKQPTVRASQQQQASQQRTGNLLEQAGSLAATVHSDSPEASSGQGRSRAPSSSIQHVHDAKPVSATAHTPAATVPPASTSTAPSAQPQPTDMPNSSLQSRAMSNLQLSLGTSTAGAPQNSSMQAAHPAVPQQQPSMQATANQLASHEAATLSHKQPTADNAVALGYTQSLLPGTSHGRGNSPNFTAGASNEPMHDQKVVVEYLTKDDRHDDPEVGNDADNEAEAEDDIGDEPNSPEDPAPSPGNSADWRRDLIVHRFRQPAPTQAQLDASMAQKGILPIIHPEAFYSNAADVPDRPVVSAGLQFKVPSSSVGNLPLFTRDPAAGGVGPMARLKATVSLMQQQQQASVSASSRLLRHVPARPPPSQQTINAWLRAESMSHAEAAVSSAAAAAQAAAGSGFVMDANTGRLVPLQSSATQNSEEDVASSLLGTPQLNTQASNAARPPVTTPKRLTVPPPQPQEEEEEEFVPASPKYDERSFFYTTPAAFRPAALAGRPQTQWATQGTFLSAAPAPAPAATSSQGNTGSFQPSQDSHKLQQQHQQEPQQRQGGGVDAQQQQQQRLQEDTRHGAGGESPPKKRPRPGTSGAPAAAKPPAFKGAKAVGAGLAPASNKKARFVSQITPPSPASGVSGPTPVSQAGFRKLVPGKGQQLTLLSIEIHADTRGSLLPDPRYDAVRAVFLAVMDDVEECPDGLYTARLLLFDDTGTAAKDAMDHVQVDVFKSEKALLEGVVDAVQGLDPDIVLGFEVQKGSLGYLADRAAAMEMGLLKLVSRTPEFLTPKDRQNDEYGQLHASGIHCTGRIVLNTWRILRSELKLNIYTFESCVAAVLQLRTPHVQPQVLTHWFNGGPAGGRWRCLNYWLRRTRLNLALMEQLDLIGRTAELARAFGIDFFSVLSRGSQYRVESMMVRLAHTQNYLMLSPAKEQVANQPAMEAVPLILEPESRFYTDPVLVLDFQSLYPSIIIAYNLCYSTVVGRPAHAAAAGEEVQLGAAAYGLPKGSLTGPNAPDKLVVAANGVAYLPHEARPGIIPRLLQEILSTRIMVKAAMKSTPASNKVLQRVMNARQFGLKLIANVTYGYTSAGFSGRMPMAEIADSIVQSARETLENAIRMVEADDKWKARVVYGDTDSMFVLLPGRSREDAFKIGTEISQRVTASNPAPVTLKFEKVYHPCVLLTKKRYVGYMYESPKQTSPGFDAKGIETVRRDTCPAVAKTMEKSLRLLFATRDLSEVKEYLERQWGKILANRVSVQDFVFAKEVRLGTYSPKAAVVPPAAIVAAKAMATDPRAEPRFAERVPYVVVYGEPGARLVDMVVSPHALVESHSRLRLHSIYYITKQIIPALERVFSLVGADLRAWFAAMPRPQKLLPQKRPQEVNALREAAGPHPGPSRPAAGLSATIDRYYLSRHCAVCDGLTHAAQPLCDQCQTDPQLAAAVLTARSGRLERQYVQLVRICLHCGGGGGRHVQNGGIVCDSLDCGVYYERRKVAHELAAASALGQAGLALLEQ